MPRTSSRTVLFSGLLLVFGFESPTTRPDSAGPAGQDAATVVAPGVISTAGGESWITMDPAGTLAVFGRHANDGWNHHTIHTTTRTAAGWSPPGGAGRSDIYIARMRGTGAATVERMAAPVNTSLSEPDVFVDPDQQFLIIARTDDPAGRGGDDLYLVTKTAAGTWDTPRNLGPAVNTDVYEYGPFVSADRATLYFTRHRGGEANIYRIPTSSIGIPVNKSP